MNLYENFKNKNLPFELQKYLDNAIIEAKETFKFDDDCVNFMIGFLLGRKYDEYEDEFRKLGETNYD